VCHPVVFPEWDMGYFSEQVAVSYMGVLVRQGVCKVHGRHHTAPKS
jgi:hypothetical protein